MKFWIAAIVAVASMILCSTVYAEDWTVSVLTNETTDQLEGRVGVSVDDDWEVGLLARWYTEDVQGADWGGGGYLKMAVDPHASIALSNWIPPLGDWFNLPESVAASTYLIGKLLYTDHDDGGAMAGAIGAGFEVGPAVLEVVYDLVDGGAAEEPMATSGMSIWFGCVVEF